MGDHTENLTVGHTKRGYFLLAVAYIAAFLVLAVMLYVRVFELVFLLVLTESMVGFLAGAYCMATTMTFETLGAAEFRVTARTASVILYLSIAALVAGAGNFTRIVFLMFFDTATAHETAAQVLHASSLCVQSTLPADCLNLAGEELEELLAYHIYTREVVPLFLVASVLGLVAMLHVISIAFNARLISRLRKENTHLVSPPPIPVKTSASQSTSFFNSSLLGGTKLSRWPSGNSK